MNRNQPGISVFSSQESTEAGELNQMSRSHSLCLFVLLLSITLADGKAVAQASAPSPASVDARRLEIASGQRFCLGKRVGQFRLCQLYRLRDSRSVAQQQRAVGPRIGRKGLDSAVWPSDFDALCCRVLTKAKQKPGIALRKRFLVTTDSSSRSLASDSGSSKKHNSRGMVSGLRTSRSEPADLSVLLLIH